jgi:hypothetical protein
MPGLIRVIFKGFVRLMRLNQVIIESLAYLYYITFYCTDLLVLVTYVTASVITVS